MITFYINLVCSFTINSHIVISYQPFNYSFTLLLYSQCPCPSTSTLIPFSFLLSLSLYLSLVRPKRVLLTLNLSDECTLRGLSLMPWNKGDNRLSITLLWDTILSLIAFYNSRKSKVQLPQVKPCGVTTLVLQIQ